MSLKALVGIVAVIVVVGLGAFAYVSSQPAVSPQAVTQGSSSTEAGTQTTNSTSGYKTIQTRSTTKTTISSKENSDAALSQDMSNVDAQMTGLNSDNAGADKGINNQTQ